MPIETTFEWEGRSIRLSYTPRRWTVIDHVEISSLNGDPLPISKTGFKSHFFGPVEPALSVEEVEDMIVSWLDEDASKSEWRDYLEQSQQLSLF